jgi:hypothetical protein
MVTREHMATDPAQTPGTARAPQPQEGKDDFSLVLGGPLYQLLRRSHLSNEALGQLRQRVVAITLITWLPLLILSALGGRAWGDAVRVPFLRDAAVQTRFLLALPLLIVAEMMVHRSMRPLIGQFLERGLIPETSRASFDAARASSLRLRNSVIAEVLLIAFAYLVGVHYIWPRYGALNVATWYATPAEGGSRLTAAGWWFVYASLPAFQFLALRWYFRLFVWIRFLWQVTRCKLDLVPTHPDRAGGLGFLSLTVVGFTPLLAAHGAWLAGGIANRIFFQGATLPDFQVELVVIVAFLLLVVLGPLLLFLPHLAEARRVGLLEYGALGQRYVREFDDKWLRGGARAGEALVGSGDIQSLADMSNSFEVVWGMRVVPFTRFTVLQLAVITLLPIAPLLLTMFSPQELFERLLRVAF